jgi:very-short-patch-repair endonuclease
MEQGWNPALNRGRHKKSFLELSFKNWLDNIGYIDFEEEFHFRNKSASKSYYVDFFFPKLNIGIELDGTQHLLTVDQDRMRDDYIKENYGVKIIRISYKEYMSGNRIDEIYSLLYGAAGQ